MSQAASAVLGVWDKTSAGWKVDAVLSEVAGNGDFEVTCRNPEGSTVLATEAEDHFVDVALPVQLVIWRICGHH